MLVWSAFALAMVPLVSLVWTVLSKGLPILSAQFFQNSMRGILGEGGGIYHALLGTLIITALATVISVPIGVLCAIYLVEYGKGSKLARVITFLVDVMTGIPSIVAGLFVMETVSVILQVGSFRLFGGRRVFRMAPVHHHFELGGWPETTVIVRFWIISGLCTAVGLGLFYADSIAAGVTEVGR